MKRFINKILLFFVAPLIFALLIAVPYFITDPYMDFRKRDNYSWKYRFQRLGDISTKKLLNSKSKYNSFIFGSSRSISLYACYLNKVIPNSNFYHYANWNERINGVYKKLQLIDSLGYAIDNAIIYIDTDCSFEKNGENSINNDHYSLTKQKKNDLLLLNFKSFYKHISLEKINILLGQPVKGPIHPNWHSDSITNDPKHVCSDPKILQNYSKILKSENHIQKVDSLKALGLFKRPSNLKESKKQISDAEVQILTKITKLFKKHSTNYYVIITPLYDQKTFNTADKSILNEIFGDKLFDFSGVNQYTNDETNYPDLMHFQSYISKQMIDSILLNKATNVKSIE